MLTTPRILGALGILLVFVLAAVWIWNTSGDVTLNQIERQNNEAGNASDDSRSDFDACLDGMWDFGARKCRGPAPGRRD